MKSWLSRIVVAQMCCWSDETMCRRLLGPLNTEHVQVCVTTTKSSDIKVTAVGTLGKSRTAVHAPLCLFHNLTVCTEQSNCDSLLCEVLLQQLILHMKDTASWRL